ncbi:MAG: class I SAM-dependent methyltransferase [Fimbriimonas sp.]|nr:class I SAM-dependent methyltransferase [Fimbriimonas sp.]
MLVKSFLIPDALKGYVAENWVHEPDILRRLREETSLLKSAGMQIGPDQGVLMGILTKLIGAKRCLEVGVFTGYSSLSVAMALPPDGILVALDVNEEYTGMARRYWEEAGVTDKIQLHLAPAVETLDALLADGHRGSFDFAFIDADKPNYLNYYHRVLELLRPNGLLLMDNVLWSGRIADPNHVDPETTALRELNAFVHEDDRVEACLIPIGDGVSIVRKK